MIAYVVDCVDCGHCVDLGSYKDTDPKSLVDTRVKIIDHFS